MCIVILTTAHPKYALIVLDNRDEYILRPTSRPHWWGPSNGTPTELKGKEGADKPGPVLSSRDLQRRERGTWFGVTRTGRFAVLTNYRETDATEPGHPPVHGLRSRGAMVTSWLCGDVASKRTGKNGSNADGGKDNLDGATDGGGAEKEEKEETTAQYVARMLGQDGRGLKGVGGFSLILGRLRRMRRPRRRTDVSSSGQPEDGKAAAVGINRGSGGECDGECDGDGQDVVIEKALEPLAVISNRHCAADEVPWICSERGAVYALSNTSYTHRPAHDNRSSTDGTASEPAAEEEEEEWPKIANGKRLVRSLVDIAVAESWDEERLLKGLFGVLDTDTLPRHTETDVSLDDYIHELKKTIFVPAIGGAAHREAMSRAQRGEWNPEDAMETDDMESGVSVLVATKQAATTSTDVGATTTTTISTATEATNTTVHHSSCVSAVVELRAEERPDPASGFSSPYMSGLASPVVPATPRRPLSPPLSSSSASNSVNVSSAMVAVSSASSSTRTSAATVGPNGFETGMYGTQRQTVLLVDWDGNVTYVERALWDEQGRPVPRGEGDAIFRFKIEGF